MQRPPRQCSRQEGSTAPSVCLGQSAVLLLVRQPLQPSPPLPLVLPSSRIKAGFDHAAPRQGVYKIQWPLRFPLAKGHVDATALELHQGPAFLSCVVMRKSLKLPERISSSVKWGLNSTCLEGLVRGSHNMPLSDPVKYVIDIKCSTHERF